MAIENYLELATRAKKEEYTDTGELWDVARNLANAVTMCLNTYNIEEEFEGSEFLLEAAFKVFGREKILSQKDTVAWIEEHFEGTYENIGIWACENASFDMRDEVGPYLDWAAYGQALAKRMGLTWVKGGEGIYLFHKDKE